MTGPRCDTCRWWHPGRPVAGIERSWDPERNALKERRFEVPSERGEGRAAPPHRTWTSDAYGNALWPTTGRDDWCAAHTPKQTRARPEAQRFPRTREEDLA